MSRQPELFRPTQTEVRERIVVAVLESLRVRRARLRAAQKPVPRLSTDPLHVKARTISARSAE